MVMAKRKKKFLLMLVMWAALSVTAFGQEKLVITPLTGDFYVFTTYHYFKSSRIPANGMFVVTNRGVVLFDTPWDTTQFQPLLDSIRRRHRQPVVLCFATHFHEDRTGGLEYYSKRGVNTYTTKKTDSLSKQRGMKRAEFLMRQDTSFTVGQYSFEIFYPGHGHAPDNIVVWFEKEKVLYGSCLIKSAGDGDLGNLGDASVVSYASTVDNVQRHCKNPQFIITGHNDWRDTRSLAHTLEMAKALKRNGR